MNHVLKVSKVHKETEDSLFITFYIPKDLRKLYKYHPGQFVVLETQIDGKTYKRPYSLCGKLIADQDLSILVKRVPGGIVSNYLNDAVKPGTSFKVHTPEGVFSLLPSLLSARSYAFFAAGCGITPIVSMMEAVLKSEPLSKIVLFYSNKSWSNTIFRERLDELQASYPKRLSIYNALTAESSDGVIQGRLDGQKCQALIQEKVKNYSNARYYMCGPIGFMDNILLALEALKVPGKHIRMEYFSLTYQTERYEDPVLLSNGSSTIPVEVVIDRKSYQIEVTSQQTILDSTLAADLDANYSCRAGICSSCKAKVISGEVSCHSTGGLSKKEIEQGYVLTCQSYPASTDVKVEYVM